VNDDLMTDSDEMGAGLLMQASLDTPMAVVTRNMPDFLPVNKTEKQEKAEHFLGSGLEVLTEQSDEGCSP